MTRVSGRWAAAETRLCLISLGVLALVTGTPLGAAPEDVVRLKSGTSFRGQIMNETDQEVTMQTATGSMTFSRADIKSVQKFGGSAPPSPESPKASGAASKTGGQGAPRASKVNLRPLLEEANARARKWSPKAELCLVGAKVSYGRGVPYDAGFAFYYMSPEMTKIHMVSGKIGGGRMTERDSDAMGPTRTIRSGKYVFVHKALPERWLDLHEAAVAALRVYEKSVMGPRVKSCQPYLGYAAETEDDAKVGKVKLYWIAEMGSSRICLDGTTGATVEVGSKAAGTGSASSGGSSSFEKGLAWPDSEAQPDLYNEDMEGGPFIPRGPQLLIDPNNP